MYVYDASKFLVVVDISNLTYVIFQTYVYFYDAVFMNRLIRNISNAHHCMSVIYKIWVGLARDLTKYDFLVKLYL